MKTDYRYISYRETRDCYQVSIRVDGKNITKTCKTLEDAVAQRNNLLAVYRLNRCEIVSKEVPSLSEAFTAYMVNEVRDRVKRSTYAGYQLTLQRFMKYFGNLKIDTITRDMWQTVFSAMQTTKKLSYKYLHEDVCRFRNMYLYYMDMGIVSENPLQRIKLQMTKPAQRRAFTKAEKRKFLQTAKQMNGWDYYLFKLYFETGCRRGELLALQWQDIDFESESIHIWKTISRGKENGHYVEFIDSTKTRESVRYIPISPQSCLTLRYYYEKMMPAPDSFVFRSSPSSKNPWISLITVERKFWKIRDEAGLDKNLCIHCIRHTVASQLVTANVDLATVKEIGGWSTPDMLLSVYAHSNDAAKRAAMRNAVF